MSGRFTLEQLPPKYQAEVLRQLEPQSKPLGQARAQAVRQVEVVPAPTKPKGIRQHQGDGMNKWERAFLAELRSRYSGSLVSIHREVSLPIGNGVRYKVDFVVAMKLSEDGGASIVRAFEVKGQFRSTGIVKLKVAASTYPWIEFFLVTKQKKKAGGGWDIEGVRP